MTDRDILENIIFRKSWRNDMRRLTRSNVKQAIFFRLSESLDDYLEHRIEIDNMIVGILQDILNNQIRLADQNEGFFGDKTIEDESD